MNRVHILTDKQTCLFDKSTLCNDIHACPKGPYLAEYDFYRLSETLLILLGFKFQLIIVEDESKNYLQLSAAFL